MHPVRITKTLTAGSANCIAQSQTLAAAGNLVLNGGSVVAGVAVLDTQRRVAIVSGGDDHLRTATIYGKNEGGSPIWENLALTNAGTAVSSFDFLNVSTVAVDGAIATTVTVGTNGTGSTPWIMPSFHLTPFNIDINEQVSGSVTSNIETTQDNYWTAPRSTQTAPNVPRVYAVRTGLTAVAQATLDTAVTGYRYTITAGTGTLTAQGTQAGIANY